jgi:AAHS family 4-hydroxybenzoate transporter-like MFS transporter
MQPTLDVTQFIDRQSVSRFLAGVVLLCTLVTLADGFNISLVAFAAPPIVKAWHLNRAALGPLLSSSLVAGLIGPFLFGLLGDRLGRRSAMIGAVVMIGVFGILSGLCTSLIQLVVVRFFAGIGMSGALAVTVAAINEFAPRRLRATFVTIVFSGTTLGSGLPGLIAPPLLMHYGWQALFIVGGVAPLMLAVAVFLYLPESPKFLCLHAARHAQLVQVLRRADPGFQAQPDCQYILGGESATTRSSIGQLFVGKLAALTPLLWLGSFLVMLVFYSFNSWLVQLLSDEGLPYSRATLALTLFQFVGTLGGWVIARPLDRFGMIPCTVLYVLSVPVIAGMGLPGNSETTLLLLTSAAGFCVLGLHFAQVSAISNIYSTPVRAMGIGWFMIFARAGGAIGPLIVSFLVGRHIPLHTLFYYAALPLAVGTVASAAVTLIYRTHYHAGRVATDGNDNRAEDPGHEVRRVKGVTG